MAAFGPRALIRAALIFALLAAAAAAASSPAHGGSKTFTGKICGKKDAACVKCSKSSKSFSCLACSTGPVDAELNENGRCVCPVGSALTGSKLTVKASGSTGGNGKKGAATAHGGKGSGPATCSECAEDSYAPEAKLVSSSRCKKCPTGTTTRGETGSATCYVEPGYYFDPSKPDGQQVIVCPVDQHCPGGDITGDGLDHFDCPAGSGTQGTTGNDELSDCIVPAGSFYNPDTGKVEPCTTNFYCFGGSVTGDGQIKNACPAGSFTNGPGASKLGQCIVPPGSYYNPDTGAVQSCDKNYYCSGGSVTGDGQIKKPCPTGTTTASTGSTSISQCLVPPGSYWDGGKVVTCTAGNFCMGGPVDGAGKNQTPCPPGQTSNPGASNVNQCFPICTGLVCSGQCIDPNTDSNNCGTCGNKCPDSNTCFGGKCACGAAGNDCPVGSVCIPFGATQQPTCVCTNLGLPVFEPKPLACNTKIYVQDAVQAFELDVTPGQPYSLTYNSFAVPDRFAVTEGTPCGPIILDTGFTGLVSSGCAQSAPCCVTGLTGACTGTAGDNCPADPTAIPGPGGGPGTGTSATFIPTKSKIYVIGFGVCDVTGYEVTVNCP